MINVVCAPVFNSNNSRGLSIGESTYLKSSTAYQHIHFDDVSLLFFLTNMNFMMA